MLPAIRKWIDYLVSRSENHLVVREEEGGWCLGDWCTLEKCRIPEPLVNTWYLVKQLGMLGEICEALGEPFDEKYETLRDDALESLRLTYFSGDTPENRQGFAVFGASLGLADPDDCAEYYDRLGHFDT